MGWGRGLLALAIGLAVLAALDGGLRLAGALPPDDPLLFFARTREPRVDPFVEVAPGRLAIRPDWVNDGVGLRGRRGQRAGRQFLLPGFRPAEIARKKPEGALRVVALGDSTAYGLYVGGDAAFPARLGSELARQTGRSVEALNLGCAGFASDRVLALLPTALALGPDLVVVYVGHNEMLGGSEGPAAGLSPALRLRAGLLAHSALFAWLDHAWTRALRATETERVREEAAAVEAGEIPTFVPEAVPASQRVAPPAAFRARAAQRYRANLEAMVAAGRAAGVPILFVLPVENLRWPPGLSFHAQGFAQQKEFDAALRAAAALREAGKPDRALAEIERAIALSPEHAMARYEHAELLEQLGRADEARSEFRAAIDRDGVTHRLTTPLEAVFLGVMSREETPWIDLRERMRSDSSDAVARQLFVDHVHPTAYGHAEIAEQMTASALFLLASQARATSAQTGGAR